MSRTVFILGAGASAEAGAPLMANFLDVANDLRPSVKEEPFTQGFDLVFKARAELQRVHSKAVLDLDNIESVFAAFEMAELIGGLGNLREDEIKGLDPAIRRLIVRTLTDSIRFPVKEKKAWPPGAYHEFVGLVGGLRAKANDPRAVSVITFNYDIALDYAFHFSNATIDYCLSPNEAPKGIPVLKLHGSLNWGRCHICGSIAPWHLRDFFMMHQWDLWAREIEWAKLDIGPRISTLSHCGKLCEAEPAIVPPTWNKTMNRKGIENVWRCAAREFSEAETIIVIGYSLPETDYFFRYLYGLGTISERILRAFWVFDPDPDNGVSGRFQKLLGPAAINRFRAKKAIFSKAIAILKEELGIREE